MRRKFIAAPLALLTSLALAAGPVSAEEPTETPTVEDSADADTGTEGDALADDGPVCVIDESTVEPVAETPEAEPTSEPAEEPAAGELPVEPAEEPFEVPAGSDVRDMLETAEIAQEAALEMNEDETSEQEEKVEEEEIEEEEDASSTELGRAKESLDAAFQRLCQPGAGGNGVAADVLAALIAGKSPAGIGAAHGKEMALNAKERRIERQETREEAKAERGRPDVEGEDEVELVEEGGPDATDQPEEAAVETEDVVQAEDAGRPAHAGGPKSDSGVSDTSDESADTSGGRPADAGNGGGNGKGKGRP